MFRADSDALQAGNAGAGGACPVIAAGDGMDRAGFRA